MQQAVATCTPCVLKRGGKKCGLAGPGDDGRPVACWRLQQGALLREDVLARGPGPTGQRGCCRHDGSQRWFRDHYAGFVTGKSLRLQAHSPAT